MPILKHKYPHKEELPNGMIKSRNGETMAKTEYLQRCQEWDIYYDKVQNTPTKAYSRYIVMRDALKQGRMDIVRQLAKEAKKQLEDQEWEISKPNRPDPRFIG